MDITARRLAGGRIQPRRKTLADNDNNDDDDDDDDVNLYGNLFAPLQ